MVCGTLSCFLTNDEKIFLNNEFNKNKSLGENDLRINSSQEIQSQFQFEEDENGDGLFTAASEDRYAKEIKVDWVGWKLISVKYSDLVSLVDGAQVTPNGNGNHDSNKIKTINMLHLANPNSGFAKSKLDYIIFTENGPLVP